MEEEEEGDDEEEEEEEEEEEDEEEDEEEEAAGLEALLSGQSLQQAFQTEAGFSSVAAAAEQFQPKGITLDTTTVKTPIPHVLRGTLREYQHIGLDWLVAMHQRKLNGILADEMGLGKTIQTIALLAYLALQHGNWGPHLIVVPTSVLLNWEYEFKRWCPAFKILTYFGSFKERKAKRIGWSKRNAFHVCVTSYNVAVQDSRAFKQKRWKYLVLDEAQHIKNFRSQRWQTLLTFNSARRLLLTGTPLQNHLMELWSLMHFLMPSVFTSHSDFREWFSNPLSGMVEGSHEYNESIVRRLHQVLRPFLLRRLKMEVEKQMPKKFEHIILCRLSKRQRFLYDEYMARAKTKDSLASGNYLSVVNILMQLRKVCNHPDLFEPRPILSPFRMEGLSYRTASLACQALDYDPFRCIDLDCLNLRLVDYELCTEAFAAFRSWQLQGTRALLLDPAPSPGHAHSPGQDEAAPRASAYLDDLSLPSLKAQRDEWASGVRRHVYEVNSRRCRRTPMYGRDLVCTVRGLGYAEPVGTKSGVQGTWRGHAACVWHMLWGRDGGGASTLSSLLVPICQRADSLGEILRRFVIVIPSVTAPPLPLHTHHPAPSTALREKRHASLLAHELSPRSEFLHCVATATSFQFPETRLIQYDCGKLQTLDQLLHQLKSGGHRTLLFTQMARMLDVLEIFLNYHGHTYLRLDGATPVQRRHSLMERFNRDDRVFCFILSTRSGGLGVNLTGADTVIFYDSDWNPTMDAQAQDRCHRIGQTRDVHIYRLVCEQTVEENILKKANQKRLLGDIAIEGGAFTTDFFKQASLRDLFHASRPDSSEPVAPREEGMSQRQIEELLLQAEEDENDVAAAHMAREEEAAELAEFDEGFSAHTAAQQEAPVMGEGGDAAEEPSGLDAQLSGVERYAVKFLEAESADFTAEQLRIAEENIEQAKKGWELSHLQSLHEREERLEEEEGDVMMLTYDRPEAANKMYVDESTGEEMPMWLPPTPPSDEDAYFDLVLDMSYETTATMTTTVLASMAPYSTEDYDVFGLWRPPLPEEPLKKTHRTSKQTREHVNVPQSLFWRRVGVDALSTKLRRLASHQKKLKSSKDQFTPLLEQQPSGPDWTHSEDWVLLVGVTSVLEFSLSLAITVPAQVPNWNIVADISSAVGKIRRSPLQCRERLMSVVIPREDSTTKSDDSDSKKHRSRDGGGGGGSVKKHKARKEQSTRSLVLGGCGQEQTARFSDCFQWLLQSSSSRKETPKFSLDGVQKPSTHSDQLKEYGINIDVVLSPRHIALQRAERIQTLPRGPVHQLLTNQQQYSHLSQLPAPRSFHPGAAMLKPSSSELGKGYGFPLNRQPITVSAVATPPLRFQPPLPPTPSGGAYPAPPKARLPGAAMSGAVTTASLSLPLTVTGACPPVSFSIPAASQISPAGIPSSLPLSLATSVAKSYVASGMSDISKTIVPQLVARGSFTPQHAQFLLLRQSALQQQQQQQQQSGAQLATPPQPPPPTPAALAGLEQIRPMASLPLQRFPGLSSAAAQLRGVSTTRSLQTEEVLALLKQQQTLKMATQSYKVVQAAQLQARELQFPLEPKPMLAPVATPPVAVATSSGVDAKPTPSPLPSTSGVQPAGLPAVVAEAPPVTTASS